MCYRVSDRRFLTDKAVEELLEYESRYLPLPEGGARAVTDVKTFWLNYDLVLKHSSLSSLEISAMAIFRAAKDGVPFEDALKRVISDLRDEVEDKVNAERIEYLIERLVSAQSKFRNDFRRAVTT